MTLQLRQRERFKGIISSGNFARFRFSSPRFVALGNRIVILIVEIIVPILAGSICPMGTQVDKLNYSKQRIPLISWSILFV
jgi:hypothetical protein